LALDITLDPNQRGRTFEGIGAVSAGASSRLLIDYSEPQRSQILDYLFKPNYGAALQHLKIEIGGEINSTDGTEPTHMRSATDQNYTRGYEWWLMQQAKARNPAILLDCLAWGAPGWIGGGNYNSQDLCSYIVNFLKGAQTQYGLTFNFTGTHNESTINAPWIKQLRSTIDASGFQNIQLVAADEWGGTWNIVTNTSYGLLMDPALSNAVARIGAHYPQSASPVTAQSCSQPLWSSEDGGGGSTYVERFKSLDPRRLWTSGSGWPQIPENQFHVTPDPRVQQWGDGLNSRINARVPETTTDYRDYVGKRAVPVISHEIGQWCVYPNFAEIHKYTGYLRPKNFEIFRDALAEHHMGDEARPFLLASGKLQTLCYKEDIESALRTPGMGGFELLDLHDFPGQGTALVGVLDPFWEGKGYVTAAEYSRFCNRTVPLARMTKRVFTADEHFKADLEVANFGPAPMNNAVMAWKLVSVHGKIFAQGALPAKTIPVDNGIALGGVDAALNKVAAPAKYKLVVGITGTKFANDWDIWIYPTNVNPDAPANVAIMHDLDQAALTKLDSGGKVLVLISPARVRNATKDPVKLGFSSIFWNTAWTGRQAPTTLGILCDPMHPAFADFPTDFCSDWQWWYLVHGAGAMILDDLPANLRPTVQVIDDWVTARKLGLVFEARLGKGKLLVCSIDIDQDIQRDPVRRQFRRSLFNYVAGEKFNPQIPVTADQVRGLFAPARNRLEVRSIKADSEEDGYEAKNAIDGDPDSLWHTRWTDGAVPHPHVLTIKFKEPMALRGVAVLPRQDDKRNGWIKGYECYVSADGMSWGAPAAKGTFSADARLKSVSFERPVTARFIRFIALTGFDDAPFTSIAEFSLLQDGTSQ
jgi:hypothetical protein